MSATIFSTNNLKQTVTAAVEACLSRRDGEVHDKMVQKALFFGGTLVCFHLGVAAGYGLWLLVGDPEYLGLCSASMCLRPAPCGLQGDSEGGSALREKCINSPNHLGRL